LIPACAIGGKDKEAALIVTPVPVTQELRNSRLLIVCFLLEIIGSRYTDILFKYKLGEPIGQDKLVFS
jgi:hypothetical protein